MKEKEVISDILERLEYDIISVYSDFEKQKELLYERKLILNSLFEFTDENVEALLQLNDALMCESNLIYDEIASMKEDFDRMIAEGKTYYKNYHIEGRILFYYPDETEPRSESDELKDIILTYLEDFWWQISADSKYPFESRNKVLMMDSNWDIVPLNNDNLLKGEPYICHALHGLVDHTNMIAMQDIVQIKPENIWHKIEVCF